MKGAVQRVQSTQESERPLPPTTMAATEPVTLTALSIKTHWTPPMCAPVADYAHMEIEGIIEYILACLVTDTDTVEMLLTCMDATLRTRCLTELGSASRKTLLKAHMDAEFPDAGHDTSDMDTTCSMLLEFGATYGGGVADARHICFLKELVA